ncbi:uncharacterized protein LOC126484657 [Schistocerca serialis cubense]|uniref:uncharacterized protein LOC126484657 n=1 Tax=Schistocerca serialis cubense TaxID=2023355 RepID=UPI00214EA220|nr:uncharacterized protein LOC126484657 [Schistocerca serialis cubense]
MTGYQRRLCRCSITAPAGRAPVSEAASGRKSEKRPTDRPTAPRDVTAQLQLLQPAPYYGTTVRVSRWPARSCRRRGAPRPPRHVTLPGIGSRPPADRTVTTIRGSSSSLRRMLVSEAAPVWWALVLYAALLLMLSPCVLLVLVCLPHLPLLLLRRVLFIPMEAV